MSFRLPSGSRARAHHIENVDPPEESAEEAGVVLRRPWGVVWRRPERTMTTQPRGWARILPTGCGSCAQARGAFSGFFRRIPSGHAGGRQRRRPA
eukprot:1392646-Amorphochlora_amoeboformis.AAC.1